ncbi:MAG TPA: deoxyribonuclease IV [Fimbriimonas sp.]
MSAKLLGAHMPTSSGLGKAVRAGKEIGCTAVQVFTSSPQMWRSKPITDDMVADFRKACQETGIDSVVSHDSYLINLCAEDPAKREQSIQGLKGEIGRCDRYGIPFVVSHMGAHVGQGEECGLQGVAESVHQILAETPETVTLLMETTAGQGSCLNHRFEHLGYLLNALKGHPRLGVCLDTCHVFAAGYDIRDEETYGATFGEFERIVGLDRLKVIHCNDSKKELGKKVDRHEHIGEGEIGETAFRLLVNDPRFENTPILLETPAAPEGHERNLAKLKSLISVPDTKSPVTG